MGERGSDGSATTKTCGSDQVAATSPPRAALAMNQDHDLVLALFSLLDSNAPLAAQLVVAGGLHALCSLTIRALVFSLPRCLIGYRREQLRRAREHIIRNRGRADRTAKNRREYFGGTPRHVARLGVRLERLERHAEGTQVNEAVPGDRGNLTPHRWSPAELDDDELEEHRRSA